jgi:hypothetical protein
MAADLRGELGDSEKLCVFDALLEKDQEIRHLRAEAIRMQERETILKNLWTERKRFPRHGHAGDGRVRHGQGASRDPPRGCRVSE